VVIYTHIQAYSVCEPMFMCVLHLHVSRAIGYELAYQENLYIYMVHINKACRRASMQVGVYCVSLLIIQMHQYK